MKCQRLSQDRRCFMREKLLNKSNRRSLCLHYHRHLLTRFSVLSWSKMLKRFIYKEERSCKHVSEDRHRSMQVRKLTKNLGPSLRWPLTLKFSIVHFYLLDFLINNKQLRIATNNKQPSKCWNSHTTVLKTLQTIKNQLFMISYLTEYNS